jgi:hypothetical protein
MHRSGFGEVRIEALVSRWFERCIYNLVSVILNVGSHEDTSMLTLQQ